MDIILTSSANKNLHDNVDFLLEHWGKKVAQEYYAKVDKCMKLISQNHQIGQRLWVENQEYRKLLVVRQIYMIYKVVDNRTIYVMTFWNNYQNPRKLKQLLS